MEQKEELKFRTKQVWIDKETGEKLEELQVQQEYTITKKYKHATRTKNTVYTTWYYECTKKWKQLKLEI